MNINRLFAPKTYYLSLLNEYYENLSLSEEKRKKIIDIINKRIYKLVNYINKKPFFLNKNKNLDELILLVKYINYYTIANKDNNNIKHYDFNLLKNEKIIKNIFLKYINDEFLNDLNNNINIANKHFTHITIFSIIEYTARNDIFNITTVYNNIISYLENKIDIYENNKYVPPYDIIVENIPVKKKKN